MWSTFLRCYDSAGIWTRFLQSRQMRPHHFPQVSLVMLRTALLQHLPHNQRLSAWLEQEHDAFFREQRPTGSVWRRKSTLAWEGSRCSARIHSCNEPKQCIIHLVRKSTAAWYRIVLHCASSAFLSNTLVSLPKWPPINFGTRKVEVLHSLIMKIMAKIWMTFR